MEDKEAPALTDDQFERTIKASRLWVELESAIDMDAEGVFRLRQVITRLVDERDRAVAALAGAGRGT